MGCLLPTDPADDLTVLEREVVGLWWSNQLPYEYYMRFNADRTACWWIEDTGHPWRRAETSYRHWSVSEEEPAGSGRHPVALTDTDDMPFPYPIQFLRTARELMVYGTHVPLDDSERRCRPKLRNR